MRGTFVWQKDSWTNVFIWYNLPADWRGARVDDWGGLENRCGLWATVGSNPTLSASKQPDFLSKSGCFYL